MWAEIGSLGRLITGIFLTSLLSGPAYAFDGESVIDERLRLAESIGRAYQPSKPAGASRAAEVRSLLKQYSVSASPSVRHVLLVLLEQAADDEIEIITDVASDQLIPFSVFYLDVSPVSLDYPRAKRLLFKMADHWYFSATRKDSWRVYPDFKTATLGTLLKRAEFGVSAEMIQAYLRRARERAEDHTNSETWFIQRESDGPRLPPIDLLSWSQEDALKKNLFTFISGVAEVEALGILESGAWTTLLDQETRTIFKHGLKYWILSSGLDNRLGQPLQNLDGSIVTDVSLRKEILESYMGRLRGCVAGPNADLPLASLILRLMHNLVDDDGDLAGTLASSFYLNVPWDQLQALSASEGRESARFFWDAVDSFVMRDLALMVARQGIGRLAKNRHEWSGQFTNVARVLRTLAFTRDVTGGSFLVRRAIHELGLDSERDSWVQNRDRGVHTHRRRCGRFRAKR